METVENPFIVSGSIDPEYFCDRRDESARLIKSLTNGNNVVLMSPRRMGKTGLIQFCYGKRELNGYRKFFIDILHTTGLKELTYLLGKEVFNRLASSDRRMISLLIRTLKSISRKLGFDPVSGLPAFSLELGDIDRPEYTLEEIFTCLQEAGKPCIVAIDEFQQVAKYPEKNIEALLRSHIQRISNAKFIFAGSERHLMQEMFTSSARPFYQSADMLELGPIERSTYIDFVTGHFRCRNRSIEPETAGQVYDLFEGNTYCMQRTFNESFADTTDGGTCTTRTTSHAIRSIITMLEPTYREILSNIPEKQKELLYAIAIDGKAESITSAAFIRRHSLSSASSVQAASKKLLERGLVTNTNGTWYLNDMFFGMWIRTLYGTAIN